MLKTHRAVTCAVLVACLAVAPLAGTAAAGEPAPPPTPATSALLIQLAAQKTRSPFVLSGETLRQALLESDAGKARVPPAAYGQYPPPPYPPPYPPPPPPPPPYHYHHNGLAEAAIIFGSAAVIAGTGLLIYSNRPECDAYHSNGCYGEKVFGGSLLAGGAVSLIVGIATWH